MLIDSRWFKLLFVALVLGAALWGAAPLPVSQAADPIAVIEPQQGLVQYRQASASEMGGSAPDGSEADWHTLIQAQLVAEGDWIRTDHLGLADLTFFEGFQSQILPDTLVQVTTLQQMRDPTTNTIATTVTLSVSVGDMRHQILQVMDPQSHYEVETPNAVITVRGTDFWTSTTWLDESIVNVLEGHVQAFGKSPEGFPGPAVEIAANQSVNVYANGLLGAVTDLQRIPEYPPQALLAPTSCGNGVCDPGEDDTLCALDCGTFPDCGDRLCDRRAGEGPVTCAADCVPVFRPLVDLPCTALTNQQLVPLRIGPGPARPIRMYMPVGQEFPVKGQAQGDDGALWYQLEVPNVTQAWVQPGDVVTSGACQAVPQAEVPPVIVAPQQPVQQPTQPLAQPSVEQPVVTDTPVPVPLSVSFVADKTTVKPGECVTVRWDVEGVREVYYQGQGVVGHGSANECLRQTTTYTLTVVLLDGSSTTYTVTVSTDQPAQIN